MNHVHRLVLIFADATVDEVVENLRGHWCIHDLTVTRIALSRLEGHCDFEFRGELDCSATTE